MKRGQLSNIGVEAAVSKLWGEKRTNPKHWGFLDYYPFKITNWSAGSKKVEGAASTEEVIWSPKGVNEARATLIEP